MRLLNITNRYYIVVALALLLVSSAFLAYRVLYVVDEEITVHMMYTRLQLEKQIASQPQLQGRPFFIGDFISVDTISRFTTFRVDIKDTLKYDPYEEGMIPFRVMTYEQQIAGDPYRITIAQRITQNNDLFNGLGSTLLLVAIDIFVCFYFLNRYFSTAIWRPFYRALDSLKRFDLQRGGNVRFEKSRVDEFNVLNEELTKLTEKVADDYRNLREFTENMSHETQTPLAVIRSKLELLLQADNLNPEQMQQVHATLDAVNRLSKMNRGLILLTRIENEQYSEEQDIRLSDTVLKHLEDLTPFAQSRGQILYPELDEAVVVSMNPYLADILVSNLLSNAIKYCPVGGKIRVSTKNGRLQVANSGSPLKIPDNRIFERFKKGDAVDSVGLGLAIVKRIGDHYRMPVAYRFEEGMHVFTVEIAPKS